MSKYEDIKIVAAFSMFLEALEEDELSYIDREMEARHLAIEAGFSEEDLRMLHALDNA